MKGLISVAQSLFLAVVLSASFTTKAQQYLYEPNLKMGNPTAEELNLTAHEPDTTASAVILCKKGYARYNYHEEYGFSVDYQYEVRIKILKKSGTIYANIEIPYYNKETPSTDETVSSISATSYNLENGKVVKTKMKSELIFDERINNNYKIIKFSIPAAKEGSVIEYKYSISSYRLNELRNWYAQAEIPVAYAEYDISIPGYFDFNLELKDKDKINVVRKQETATFNYKNGGLHTQSVTCPSSNLKFFSRRVPSLKTDKYIWCKDDYISYVSFQLSGVTFPGELYRPLTSSWESIDEFLLEKEDFGYNLDLKNPFKNEMQMLYLDKCETNEAKVEQIFSFVKKRIKWDERYQLISKNINNEIEKKAASNATINFVMMSIMRDAGIESFPVVLSSRDNGILPITHPSLVSLNTFVVGFKETSGAIKYIDGSLNNGYINVLPPHFLVNKARIVTKEKLENKWVDLSTISENQLYTEITAKVENNNTITGTTKIEHKGQYSLSCKNNYNMAKDSAEYIEDIESTHEVKVISLKNENMDTYSPVVKETIEFSKEINSTDSLLYINPLAFAHMPVNPFTTDQRELPVELAHPEEVVTDVYITLPKGYQIDEIPKSANLQLERPDIKFAYRIYKEGDVINIKYRFRINTINMTPLQYSKLKKIYDQIVDKNNEMIVLRKI